MRVRCISSQPDRTQAQRLGKNYIEGRQQFGLVVGEIYTVFGLRVRSGELWIDTVDPGTYPGYLYSAPLLLFDIVDPRIPSIWEVHRNSEGDLRLAPPSFFGDFYFDDLFEEDPGTVEDFLRVRKVIESAEAESS